MTRLAAKLAEMIAARGTEHEDDAFFDMHHYQTAWYETWLVVPIALVDEYQIDDLKNEYFDFGIGEAGR